jgi:hypothetical protein
MPLILALLALLFIRHYSHDSLAGMFGLSSAAWFYVMGGYQEAILWFIVGGAASMGKPCLQRTLGMLVGTWGVAEGLMMGTCRIAASPQSLTPGQGLCDLALGIPAYSISIGAVLLMLAYILLGNLYGQRSS